MTMQHPFLAVKPNNGTASWRQTLFFNLAIVIAYGITGYAGLQLAFVGGAVTLFWPPSGIAFAALWLGGFRMLPGIALGAFLVNIVVMGTPQLATLVAVGNVLPATLATLVLRGLIRDHLARKGESPGEQRRVLWFLGVAAFGSTMLSATVGTLAVAASGNADAAQQSTWLVWWMGDAMGVVIVAPPILLWRRIWDTPASWCDAIDVLAFALAGLGIIAGLYFIREPIWAVELSKLFTLLLGLWAGARFGLNGPAAITLLMAVGAVGVTVMGAGPFVRDSFVDSFALLHSFLFAEAITGMLLAAALADLRRVVTSERSARGDAEAAAANRIRLLTMISHDVRTPLGGMMGVLQTLARAPIDAEQQRLVGLGLRAGTSLTALVADILDVARADAGRIRLEPAPFDPARSLAYIIDINRDAAAGKELALNLSGIADLPPFVLGDRLRFEQLLGNLVANAIAYTASGGVSISASWHGRQSRPLQIEVADTGPGIDPEHTPDMFQAFALAPRPGNRSAGLGLGLHICRSLAELMAGTIQYRAAPGGGSLFSIALPLLAADAPAPAPQATVESPQAVLLVEDDPIAREVTTALLMQAGHNVTAVADGNSAVGLVATAHFDLVLMDIHGPRSDSSGQAVSMAPGMAAARAIRALGGNAAHLLIIALTADAIAETATEARAAGMDGVIIKPLSISHGLSVAVSAALAPKSVLAGQPA